MRPGRRVLAFTVLGAAILSLASCISRIPEEVLDADWCRQMETARKSTEGAGRRNLETAMKKHHCAEKLAEAAVRERGGLPLRQAETKSDLR